MKTNATLKRALALLLLISFFVLVFSPFTLCTHHCENEEFCEICAYQSAEHLRELFIPILCACIAVLSASSLYHFSGAGEENSVSFTPVKLKVKLSD